MASAISSRSFFQVCHPGALLSRRAIVSTAQFPAQSHGKATWPCRKASAIAGLGHTSESPGQHWPLQGSYARTLRVRVVASIGT
eukprot:14424655-Alexandrium_andersonii.AAC.1